MDKRARAATGGQVIWVDFAARSGRRRTVPTISPAEWMRGARSCEAAAEQAEPHVAAILRRVARNYRARAGAE